MDFQKRREKIYDFMAQEGLDLVIFEDCERARDQSVRYLSGQPGDAILLLSAERKAILMPWDINLAGRYAQVDLIVPYTKFDLDPYTACRAGISYCKTPYGGKIEIPAMTAYPAFLKYVENLSGYTVICRSDGVRVEADLMRAVKDEDEIAVYRECAKITNGVIDMLEAEVRSGTIKSETDAALFIEAECRRHGCDGTGFTTLAAGPSRSFGIHCHPPFSGGDFASKGLSILDFGLVYQGYTSDVTLTFARSLTKTQEKQLVLVEEAFRIAYDFVAESYKPGEAGPGGRETALAVDAFFKKNGVFMPHGLGHGIGLEAHEAPYLRRAASNSWKLEKGNIFTIEPGLYDDEHGGCRLENDVLLSAEGPEILTRSRIIRL